MHIMMEDKAQILGQISKLNLHMTQMYTKLKDGAQKISFMIFQLLNQGNMSLYLNSLKFILTLQMKRFLMSL
jgi:hypothetical protein